MDGQRLIDGPMDPMGGSTATPKWTGRTDKYGQLAERRIRRYERNGMRMSGLMGQSPDIVGDREDQRNSSLFVIRLRRNMHLISLNATENEEYFGDGRFFNYYSYV